MAFAPTHRAPDGGLDAYTAPDPTPGAATQIPGGLDVEIVERRADWAQVRTGNGWEGWVDGRRLVEIPAAAPVVPPAPPVATPPAPPTPTPEPTPPAPPVVTPPVAEPTPATATPTATWGTTPPAAGTAAAGGWAAPAATAPSTSKFGPGTIVALIGAALLALTSVLAWLDFGLGDNSFKVTVKSLWSIDDFGADDFPSIGLLLLVLVALIVVGALLKPARILAVIGGGLALIVAVVYLVQAARAADRVNELTLVDFGLTDAAGVGAFLAVPAAVVALVGGVLLLAQKK